MKSNSKFKCFVLLAILLLLGLVFFPPAAKAIPFNIQGNYGGSINGDSFSATSSGWLDPETGSGQVSIDFTKIPDGYHWKLPASCWICFICCNGRLAVDSCALNMLDVTGGNYHIDRTIGYEDGSEVTLAANVSMDMATYTMSYDVIWGGSYAMGIDNIDDIVWPVEERFTQLGPGQIRSFGTSEVLLTDGSTTPIIFDSILTYSGPGVLPMEEVAYMTQEQSFSGAPDYILDITIPSGGSTIACVPEPSTGVFIIFGLIGLAGFSKRFGKEPVSLC